ncbi:transcriptional regulator [Kyrpidia spormannii]|uniref:Transcriptional regulator CtsR n=1 Tax=Kyrpidia spormannii TaxID=2055160 RepID=A0A2K8N362_9BACL|nr:MULTISPECIES: CtsR family transcriptional regulator [Kyrpidia]ATY83665.1 transcriptional regulator [Kyrpidia spormannii]MCL6575379.1 CtsR family transcriptional regulator [Kyrpidia sp.]HHY66254.1 CtsR family transcriptional regulator [Alicyclobacillus sp.]
MRNITDLIEQHLKSILQQSRDGVVEIQRGELAEQFNCVPSQINYVISTRFTVERGYIVESKRGGGGYIRIRKLEFGQERPIHDELIRLIGEEVTQREAHDIIDHLFEDGFVTEREVRLLHAAVCRDVLRGPIPYRDQLRARLLRAMLVELLRG